MTQEFVTLPREVVEQVLKAAEAFHSHYKRNIFSGCVPSEELYFSAARASLRAALEQPQGEQEPVAWIENLVGALSYNPYHEASRKLPEGVRFDLYTRPQPRQPLTDEVVLGVAKSIEIQFDSERLNEQIDDILVFARAIEHAHHIK